MVLLQRLWISLLKGPLLHRLYKLIVLLTVFPLLISSSSPLTSNMLEEDSQEVQVTRTMDPQILSRLESQFLKLFGMDKRPTRRKGAPIKIPKHLIDLYNAQTGSPFPSSSINLPGRHIRTANTVRTFYHLPEEEVDWGHRFKFDISSITPEEEVTGSELRLVFNNDVLRRNRGKVRVLVYDVIKEPKSPQEESNPAMYPMDVKLIDLQKWNQSDWLTFDIYPAVSRWLLNPEENHGLVIQMHKLNGQPIPKAAEKHIRVRRSTPKSPSEVSDEDPVLFTYSDDGVNPRSKDAKTLSRRYRSATGNSGENIGGGRNRRQGGGNGGGGGGGKGMGRKRKGHRNKNRRRNLCAKHKMFVDFADVGWSSWVVAPPGYHAYYCSGECPFPMADHLNATNHAVIQALVHSMNPQMVPPPCCVPTKYSSLSLLYTDHAEKIVLRNYQDMVVDSCGCS